ncbi:hypothetical protein [Clostridium intestinale]|uniref:hypothetical protein n=1 Tax=Clostridium intestinale TaxID=36845 RepID=UPI0028E23554|nr:hypothetical protein [Clostridium intestinale]
MLNNGLLNPKDFEIDEDYCEDTEKGMEACERLIDRWTPDLEDQMLNAFIKLYYDDMYEHGDLMTRKKVKSIGWNLSHQQNL